MGQKISYGTKDVGPSQIRKTSASSPGAFLLKGCRYMKRLHKVNACDVVSAQGEMGYVRDGECLADLVAVMANIEISEE